MFNFRSLLVAVLMLLAGKGLAEEPKFVVGPSNLDLVEGAEALREGDAERGVELTLRGLALVSGPRDRHAAWANLCAGYVMLDNPDEALGWCNKVIAEDDRNWRAYNNRALVHIQSGRYEEAAEDVARAEAISPNAKTLKTVKAMLLAETDPVEPRVTVDDRRRSPDGD